MPVRKKEHLILIGLIAVAPALIIAGVLLRRSARKAERAMARPLPPLRQVQRSFYPDALSPLVAAPHEEPVPPEPIAPLETQPNPEEIAAQCRIQFVVTYAGYLPADRFYGAHDSTWLYKPECVAIPVGFEVASGHDDEAAFEADAEMASPTPENLPITIGQEMHVPPGTYEFDLLAYVSKVTELRELSREVRQRVSRSSDKERISVTTIPGEVTVVPLMIQLEGTRADIILPDKNGALPLP